MEYFKENKNLFNFNIKEFNIYLNNLYNRYYKEMREAIINRDYSKFSTMDIDFKQIPERLQFEKDEFIKNINFISSDLNKNDNFYEIDNYILLMENVLKFIDYSILVYDSFSKYYRLISTSEEEDESMYDIYLNDAIYKEEFINNLILDYATDLELIDDEKLKNFDTMLKSELNPEFLNKTVKNIFN